MFTLKMYKNMSENNDVSKTLTNETIIKGDTRAALNILAPEIITDGININDFNYCYIVELKRYYYIESSTYNPNGMILLKMRVDVLMTYADDIKASSGLILKQRDYNPYFGEFDVEAKTGIEKLEFEDKFNHIGEFVLVALRG